MNSILRLLCAIQILCLTSCAMHQNIALHPSSQNQCKNRCMQQFETCKNICVDNCHTCSVKANQSSASSYAKYVGEEEIEGGIIARQLKSYRDPLQCRKISCNCYADFNTCTQSCTGVIQKRLQAVPNCT